MKASFIPAVWFCLLLLQLSGCETEPAPLQELGDGIQSVSLLGDTLFTRPSTLPEALEIRIDSLIDAAEANDDDLTTMLIWQARKKAYQGEYREAIDVLSSAITQYPEDARLYRHRGHRYITLRAFDLAITDFETASGLITGTEDRVEPDGLPNALNQPTSTLHTNIYYHLGLAHYLNGNFESAAQYYARCMGISNNNDMMIAALYWYYMSLRRGGKDEEAGKILEPVTENLEIIENTSYHDLLLVFKGVFEEDDLLTGSETALENATLGYGMGNWHYINGRTERALEWWNAINKGQNWAAFGAIAAEAELARLQ
ncbi:MAG: tetratricopeptide repeat protein [Bacteroidota bacterium]